MADPLSFNKIAGAVLATGLLVFGLAVNVSAILFEKTPPKPPMPATRSRSPTTPAAAARRPM